MSIHLKGRNDTGNSIEALVVKTAAEQGKEGDITLVFNGASWLCKICITYEMQSGLTIN